MPAKKPIELESIPSIAEQCRVARQAKDWSQATLGANLEPPAPQSTIGRLETDAIDPTVSLLQRIADATGVVFKIGPRR